MIEIMNNDVLIHSSKEIISIGDIGTCSQFEPKIVFFQLEENNFAEVPFQNVKVVSFLMIT